MILLLLLAGARADGPLTDALNAAPCGSVLEIPSGTYDESVIVWQECPDDARVIVRGDASDPPLIRGKRSYALGFYGGGYTFEDLRFTSDPECDLDHRVVVVGEEGHDVDFVRVSITDGGYDGFGTLCGAYGVRIVDSEVSRNGLGCVDGAGNILNGDGIDLFACVDCEVTGTRVDGNNNYAVQVKGGADGVRLHHNVLVSTSQFGVLLGKPGDTAACAGRTNAARVRVDHNVVDMSRWNAWAFEAWEVADVQIDHNTVVVHDTDPEELSGGFLRLGTDLRDGLGLRFVNNLLDSRAEPLVYPLYADGLDTTGLDAHHNLWWDATGSLTAPPDGAPGSLVAEPGFVAWPDDLALAPTSPAVDAGADLGEAYAGAAPDIGAFEWTAAPGEDVADGADPTGTPGCGCGGAAGGGAGLGVVVLGVLRRRAPFRLARRPSTLSGAVPDGGRVQHERPDRRW